MPWTYQRRKKADAPWCSKCGRAYLAGSTLGAITYYYSPCDCPGAWGRKVVRAMKWVEPVGATGVAELPTVAGVA